jgi:hypothetical protein
LITAKSVGWRLPALSLSMEKFTPRLAIMNTVSANSKKGAEMSELEKFHGENGLFKTPNGEIVAPWGWIRFLLSEIADLEAMNKTQRAYYDENIQLKKNLFQMQEAAKNIEQMYSDKNAMWIREKVEKVSLKSKLDEAISGLADIENMEATTGGRLMQLRARKTMEKILAHDN